VKVYILGKLVEIVEALPPWPAEAIERLAGGLGPLDETGHMIDNSRASRRDDGTIDVEIRLLNGTRLGGRYDVSHARTLIEHLHRELGRCISPALLDWLINNRLYEDRTDG